MTVNKWLGYAMIALAAPAGLALVAFVRARADLMQWIAAMRKGVG